MATYLLTGACGFIGWQVAERLLADGHEVAGVDSLNDAYDTRLKHWRLDSLVGQPGFSFHHADICDRNEVRRCFDTTYDAVINLAARAGVRQSIDDPWAYFETNVIGTLNLLELCKETGVRKFVLASTSSLYGAGKEMPFREDAPTDSPLSPYAASKKAAEALTYTYHHLYGLDVTVFRYFTVFGPAGRPDMSLFRFVQWIAEGRPVIVFGDGQQSRDYTFVDDIARGTIAGLKPLGYEIINLGADSPVTVAHAIETVERLLGRKAQRLYEPRHPADVVATWADIGKATRLLGWRPQTAFEDGLSRLVEWYRENRSWAKDIAT